MTIKPPSTFSSGAPVSSIADVAAIPSWWKSLSLTPSTDSTSFARIANALIPYYSTADQTSVGVFLGADKSGLFPDYIGSAATPTVQDTNKGRFLNASRAARALSDLEALKGGQTDESMGPGFKMIKQALNLLSQLGAAGNEQGMTRAEYEQLQTGLNAIVTQAQGDQSLAPFAELAQKFINPTLPGGATFMPSYTSAGKTVYGQTNSKLFK